MSKSLIERNPFRPKSALYNIYEALARSQKALDVEEIAKRAKVPLARTSRMLAAMSNPFHNAGMRRTGISLQREDGLLSLKGVKPESNARRPERGKSKKNAAKNGKKHPRQTGKGKPTTKTVKAKAQRKSTAAAPAPAAESLNEREKLVLSTLNETPKPVDAIVAETKLKPEEVLATLLVLEVRRLVRQHPGKQYSAAAK